MSGKPAARVGDMHTCPLVSPGPVPHVGGTILPPGAANVLIGGMSAARMTDMAVCIGPPDAISSGSFPVPVMSLPAARMGDATVHGGLVIQGFATVLIGLAGTAGNTMVGTQMCQAAASGRTSGTTSQTYNNCGVESSRQIINHVTGANLNENGLLTQSINNGLASGTPGGPLTNPDGGTGAVSRQGILASNGVASNVQNTNPDNMGMAMSQGRGVIVNLDAAFLWPTTAGLNPAPGALHAVTVTGVEYDDAGNRVNIIINDTGTGQCGVAVPASIFDQATAAHPNTQLNVTNNPIF